MLKKKSHKSYQKHLKESKKNLFFSDKLQKKIKKEIDLFYRGSFFLLLIFSIVLAYFIILVSTTPKSFPFVTKEIKSSLSKTFGREVFLDTSYLSFTRYGTLKVSVDNLKFFYEPSVGQEKQQFVIPKLESEFSLFDILLLNFNPNKIKIINPEIIIGNLQKAEIESEAEPQNNATDQASLLAGVLASIQAGKLPIKNFEIENAKLIIKEEGISTEILIKKSQIRTKRKSGALFIYSSNKLNFDKNKTDVDLNSRCYLEKNDSLKCEVVLANFSTSSIAAINSNFKIFNQVDATLNLAVALSLNKGQLDSLIFKADAKSANLDFPDFFGNKIKLSDVTLKGDYNHNLGILNLSEIKANFPDEAKVNIQNNANVVTSNDANITMSLMVSDLQTNQNNKLDFYINLKNVPNDKMEKFWPKYLSERGVREWVITHIKGGVIEDAYAKFTLQKNNEIMQLEKMNAKMNFSGLNVNYNDSFPKITNAVGVAIFDQKSMKITVASADVLNSKITNSQVAIADFHAPIAMLNIIGTSKGNAADLMKHASSNQAFVVEVEKYLNGDSQNSFDIRIPLQDKISLKNTYISVNSAITNLNNDYAKGAANVVTKKNFASSDFITTIDLTPTNLTMKAFDVEKESAVEGGLNVVISLDKTNSLSLKDFSLWKKEVKQDNKKRSAATIVSLAKIYGNIEFKLLPFMVTAVDLKNNSFGKNNYTLSYKTDFKNSSESTFLKGEFFNLASFIDKKFLPTNTESKFVNSRVQIALNKVFLSGNKSLQAFYLALNCKNTFCYNGLIKAGYAKKQFINLVATQKPKEDFVTWDGRITDIGYLAEGFGISNKVSAGDFKINFTQKLVDKKSVFEGKAEINDEITIYETAQVKKLASNDLFSQIKDKIFSNDKTIFNSLKLEFSLQDKLLSIKSLIASNYKIGITAKGYINLKDDIYEIKGMIVPGFIVNNLFGIGNIPILGEVVSGLLTGGEGGGLFGIHYDYTKKAGQKEATFDTNKVSAFVPTTIRNLFDAI